MWRYTLMHAGLAAALISAMTFENGGGDAFASAMTARSSERSLTFNGSHSGTRRANDGLFYIDAQLGRGKARMLVDTGASHVTLSHADAKKAISRPDRNGGGKIATAAGVIEVDWVIIEKLEIHGHLLKNVKAAIPHSDTGLSLLGQSALVQFSGVQIKGDHLSLTQ
jgi:aspartyl protease family protein